MIYIYVARQPFTDRTISNIGLVRSKFNIAGRLTKRMSQDGLINALRCVKRNRVAEQWIVGDHSEAAPLPKE